LCDSLPLHVLPDLVKLLQLRRHLLMLT
jgi:hypothetical protein